MQLDIISYATLNENRDALRRALFSKGIVGVRGIPGYLERCHDYIRAARRFAALDSAVKNNYAPDRDRGITEGYELGAEWFKDDAGQWQIDDKKASFYACVPDDVRNRWPTETDLKTAYLALAELMFAAGKEVLNLIGLNQSVGLNHDKLTGYGRMLHYLKESDTHGNNPNWCGGHYDHGVFTSLMPAYYFQNGIEVEEPAEAGLHIIPTGKTAYEKIDASDKSVLLFQVGEFGQIILNDQIRATKHIVKKAKTNIERFTLAVFIDPEKEIVVRSSSELTQDNRYRDNLGADESLCYDDWEQASYKRYRATVNA